jgi:hypothetical protein
VKLKQVYLLFLAVDLLIAAAFAADSDIFKSLAEVKKLNFCLIN